jgi:hypothetical protein
LRSFARWREYEGAAGRRTLKHPSSVLRLGAVKAIAIAAMTPAPLVKLTMGRYARRGSVRSLR